MKQITRMLILMLFLSGVFTISSNMMQMPLKFKTTSEIETQSIATVELEEGRTNALQ